MKVLVTAGGTKEYIDGVRYIGNCSSGNTGAVLCDHLSAQGHEVTWLGAKTAVKPASKVEQISYETFEDLARELKQVLSSEPFDVVFQAAAVSDFKVSSVLLDGKEFQAGRGVKLPTADDVQLQLMKQPKLVSNLKHWSKNSELLVVAFKLTNSKEQAVRQAAVDKLIKQEAIDFVAHNDLNDICDKIHTFELHSKVTSIQCDHIQHLSDEIVKQQEVAA